MTAQPILPSIELPAVPMLELPALRKTEQQPALWQRIQEIVHDKFLDRRLALDPQLEDTLVADAKRLGRKAYPHNRTTELQSAAWIDHDTRTELHRALLVIYQQHVQLRPDGNVNQYHPLVCRLMMELESPWEQDMLRRAHTMYDLSHASLPADPKEFAAWYRDTAFSHPLYEHELYAFVSLEATREQLEWFFTMECAGEAAFDDLVALAQIGTRGDVKIEMASNYWDEMGRGRSHAVHTHLFHKLVNDLALEAPSLSELPWQVLAGVNVMLWSSLSRRNAYRAQGCLGAVELLAPQRCTRLVHGARRVGIAKKTVVYYGAHAVIDVGHAEGWLSNVIEAQVQTQPLARVGIAEGLITRADASLDYFDYCLAHARALAA